MVEGMGSGVEFTGGLVGDAFYAWRDALGTIPEVVVQPSVPILYFGDLDACRGSPLRVVTVALNPSREEFPRDDPFRRFPLTRDGGGLEPLAYSAALNSYFIANPYRSWFSSFEPLLNGLQSSYYPGLANTALHTDICSPVATDPTWSRLGPEVHRVLIAPGSPLWHDLIRQLRPHLILISLARYHLSKIEFETVIPPIDIYRIDEGRSRPYVIRTWTVRVENDWKAVVVFGRAAQRPFSLISNDHKAEIGHQISSRFDAAV